MNFLYLVPHPCQLSEAKLLSQCRIEFTRRGGPGGQHRNKVESAVVLIHEPTQILAEASERRDQSQNRRVALGRLRRQLSWLVRSVPCPVPLAPRGQAPEGDRDEVLSVSELWKSRCLERPANVSPEHWDYPTLVAESLDQLVASGWEMSTAARRLGVSTARLAKLLRADRQTLEWVNRHRKLAGFPSIR